MKRPRAVVPIDRAAPAGEDYELGRMGTRLKAARGIQQARTALTGCPTLRESTPGDTLDKKAEALRQNTDEKLIHYIAASIWNLGYTGADSADFFSMAASGSTPS